MSGLIVVLSVVSVLSAPHVSVARASTTTPPVPYNLETEGLDGLVALPVVDNTTPRLSWITDSNGAGHPTAYKVEVYHDDATGSLVWSSGQVTEDTTKVQIDQVAYAGTTALTSGSRYKWRVSIWDGTSTQSGWSDYADFQMGLLTESDWSSAMWIQASSATAPAPAPVLLRKSIAVPTGTITNATLTMAAGGFAEAFIGGAKVGNDEMEEPYTDYSKQIDYVTHDVTSMLRSGTTTVLGVWVGEGWYDPYEGGNDFGSASAPWVAQDKLRAKLDVTYADGSHAVTVTDTSWQSATGQTTWSTFLGGEDIDHTKTADSTLLSTTASPSLFNGAVNWTPPSNPKLIASPIPPERATDLAVTSTTSGATIAPVSKGKTVLFKLSENTAMKVDLKLQGTAGTTVTVQVGEGLTSDGSKVDPAYNLLNAKTAPQPNGTIRWQQMNLTLSGSGTEEFTSTFTYYAGRYVSVTVTNGQLSAEPIGVFTPVHTALEQNGSFSSSDANLNALHNAAMLTYKNNIHGLPTDCPTRERLGYGADGTTGADFGLLNFDSVAFYEKWVNDYANTEASSTSAVPYMTWTAPSAGFYDPNWFSPWWTNALVHVPVLLYRETGDMTALSKEYPAISKYVAWLQTQLTQGPPELKGWMWATQSFPPDHEAADEADSVEFNTMAVYEADIDAAAIATALGKTSDAGIYLNLATSVQTAFNTAYFNWPYHTYSRTTSDKAFSRATQGELATALAIGIEPNSQYSNVLSSLNTEIASPTVTTLAANSILSGIIGTDKMFNELAQSLSPDTAYTMLTQPKYPSVLVGPTSADGTFYEGTVGPGDSHDHPAFASVDAYLYRGIAGIDISNLFTNNAVTIRPSIPTKMTGSSAFANASVTTTVGKVSSGWSHPDSSSTKYSVVVPDGTTAKISVPVPSNDAVSVKGATYTTASDPDVTGNTLVTVASGGSITVTVQPLAPISVSPGGTLDFKDVSVKVTSSPQYLTVTNPRSTSVHISGVSALGVLVAGSSNSAATYGFASATTCWTAGTNPTTQSPAVLAANSSCIIAITACPGGVGVETGQLNVSFTDAAQITVNLSVNGENAYVFNDFGDHSIGQFAGSWTLNITNTTSSTLWVQSLGSFGSWYTHTGCKVGDGIPPGGLCSVTVSATPQGLGVQNAIVDVTYQTAGGQFAYTPLQEELSVTGIP